MDRTFRWRVYVPEFLTHLVEARPTFVLAVSVCRQGWRSPSSFVRLYESSLLEDAGRLGELSAADLTGKDAQPALNSAGVLHHC